MNLDMLNSLVSRVAFALALIFFVVAIVERIALWLGYTFLNGSYAPGRLVEFGAVCLILVATLLLRQVRELLKTTRG